MALGQIKYKWFVAAGLALAGLVVAAPRLPAAAPTARAETAAGTPGGTAAQPVSTRAPQPGRQAPDASAQAIQSNPAAQPSAPVRPAPGTDARGPAGAPATQPSIASEVGRRTIRRDGASRASATQPAPTTRAATPTPDGLTAPSLGLPKVMGALAIVLTLIFGLKVVVRRAFAAGGATGSSRAVQMLSRTILSPKQHVVLLRVGRRLIVVADSGGQMSPLSEISDPDEVAALVGQLQDEKLSAAAPTFGGLVNRFRHAPEAGPGADELPAGEVNSEIDDVPAPDDPNDPARQEINGLLAKVRLLSHQFKGT